MRPKRKESPQQAMMTFSEQEHLRLAKEPLTLEDWQEISDMMLGYSFQLRLVVERARQRAAERVLERP